MTPEPLFVEGDLSATLAAMLAKARRAVDEVPEGNFREADASELADQIFSRFAVRPVSLTEGAISVQAEETDIDRRRFSDMDRRVPGASPTLRGTRVIYNVPFSGDSNLFRLKPSTWTTSVPYAEIGRGELHFVFEVPSSKVGETKSAFDRELSLTKQWLGWGNDQVTQYNDQLASEIERAMNDRVSRLSTASEGLAELGLPVKGQEPVSISRSDRAKADEPISAGDGETHRYEVALSFAGEDRAYVEEVAAHLKNAGVAVFYDKFEAAELWGKDLIEHLQNVYQNEAEYCVLFVSEHYVTKPWPRHERRSAQNRALVAKEEYLLPARFDDSTVPGLPPSIGYVDLRELTPLEFADLILEKIGHKNN